MVLSRKCLIISKQRYYLKKLRIKKKHSQIKMFKSKLYTRKYLLTIKYHLNNGLYCE